MQEQWEEGLIAVHEPAAGGDFVIRADLSAHGMEGRGEQLWARRTGDFTFVLLSLPFFTYGMAPGDEVETSGEYVIQRVLRRSGNRLLRVAARRPYQAAVHASLHPRFEALSLASEWFRTGYASVLLEECGEEA